MLSWWDCLGRDKQLMIFVLRSSGRIIGIVPLMRVRKYFLRFPYDEVCFLSATENPFSPRAFAGTLDFLVPDEFSGECEHFIRYLLASCKGWNYLKLHPLPENSPALASFRRIASESHIRVSMPKVFDNACLSVSGSWEEYWTGRSHDLRRNGHRRYSRLMERHRAEFREYRHPEEMEQAFADILTVEQKSWKSKDGVTINDERSRDFYPTLARRLAEKKMIRIWVLKIDGSPAGYEFYVRHDKCIKTLKTSFDEAYSAFSPGTLLRYAAYRQFFREGIHHIDLLFGNLKYKQEWTNVLEPHYGVYLTRNDLYTRFIDRCLRSPAAQRLENGYRKVRHSLR